MPDIKYPKNSNSDTVFVEDGAQRTRAVKTVQPDGTIDYPTNPNSDSCYVTVDGEKQRALMVADISSAGTIDYPENSNSTKGYVTINGKKQRVVFTANIAGGGSTPVIDELNVTPSTSAQTITATGGVDGYSPVNVSAVDASIDANITAGNIKDGVTILGVTGNVVELNGETKTVTPQVYGQTLYPTSPKNAITEITVNAVTSSIDANIQAGNIKKDVTILGVTGTYEAGGGGPTYYLPKKLYEGTTLVADGDTPLNLVGVSSLSGYSLAYAYYYADVTIGATDTYCAPFSSGTGISTSGNSLDSMFYGANFTNTSFSFNGITKLASQSCRAMFKSSNIKKIYFHGLTSINSAALGNSSTTYAFSGGVQEIHFPAALQTDVEASTGYAAKWGATNATIYFDL